MDDNTNGEPPVVTTLNDAVADRFRLLVEAVGDYGIFMLDPAGNVFSWNPGALKTSGYQSEEIIGQHFSCLYIAEDVAAGKPQRGLQIALAEGRFEEEGLRLRKDGAPFWAITTITNIHDSTGQHIGFANVTRDITERKRAEEALREGQEHIRQVLNTANDPFIAMDAAGRITDWNKQAEVTYGWPRAEAIGRNLADTIIPPQHRGAHLRGLERFLATGQGSILNQRIEITASHRDGREFPVELVVWPVQVGETYSFNAFVRDITGRKQTEEAQRERVRCAAMSGDIGLALIGTETLRDMLQRCAESMVRNLNAAFARIWTLNEAENMLELRASAGMYTHIDGPHGRVPVGQFKIGLIAHERRPHLTNAVVGDPRVGDQDWAVREGMVAFAGYPLLVADRLIGVAALFARQTLSDATMQALAAVADQIALGIDRRLAEKAMRAAQQRLQHVVDSSPAVLYTVEIEKDQLRGISWMSDNIVDMLGYPVSETHGADWWMAHVHPDDVQAIIDTVHQELFGKGFTAYEYRFQHRDSSYRWVRSEIRLLCDSAGKPIEAVGSWSDITERKAAEEVHSKVQERLNGLFNSSGDGMVYTTLDGLILDANNAYCQLTGYSRDELINLRRYQDFTPPQFHEAEAARIESILRTGNTEEYEKEYQRKDGKLVSVSVTAFTVKNRQDHSVGLARIVKDITERKQLEEQYRQAQKMEAVGRLAGGVAHDFNNLLTVINGYSGMVIGRLSAGDPARKMLQQVVAAGDRAAGLTRQLLAFSRKSIIEPKILDLKAVVADVDKMLRHIIGEDILMTVVSDPEVGAVKADAGQIEQVILNLVVNARDAMPTGGQLTIEVRNAVLDESYTRDHVDVLPGGYVLLAVTDTGCGIDEKTMANIFEPFFTTKGEHGTGLGLATVHGIVKESGGHVAVYSEAGHGTQGLRIKVFRAYRLMSEISSLDTCCTEGVVRKMRSHKNAAFEAQRR